MEPNVLKTKNFWSSGIIARLYRKFAGRHFAKMHAFAADKLLRNGVKSLLDVACGPGDFLAHVKEKDPQVSVAGTDGAPGMVAHAREKLGPSARIEEADAERQPFTDGSFDAVTTMMAFHHFPNQLGACREVSRVLMPGGVYLVVDVVAKSELQKRLWNFLEKASGVRGHTQHSTELDLRALAGQAGFENFRCESVPGMAKRYRVCSFQKANPNVDND